MSNSWISRDDVFAALEMHVVLDHYGIKTGRGSSFRIHCPFHEDDRPSCSINPKAKVYNCFGCEAQGNVLDFIAEMEDLDPGAEFRAVLETAVEILGHNPSKRSKERSSKAKKTNKAKSADAGVIKTESKQAMSKSTKPSRSKKRQAKPGSETSDKGEVSSPKTDEVQNERPAEVDPNKVLEGPAFPLKLDVDHPYLKQRGFSKLLLGEFGIGFETRSSALMAGRVCFPIHNHKGELVAYSGRWADDESFIDAKGREQERYKLPTGFKKQLELYNLHRVLNEFPNTKTVVLVEGFWSVLRLHSLNRSNNGNKTNGPKETSMGIPVVSLMGLSISKVQIGLLKQNDVSNIILMLDGDKQGRKATKKILCQLSKYFFVKDAYLPDGKKPDDVDETFLLRFVQYKQAEHVSSDEPYDHPSDEVHDQASDQLSDEAMEWH